MALPSPTSPSFHTGQRVSYASALCTVRYIGPVLGTKGTWLGVEWDDDTLGKHSGEHEGVQYFKCLNSSTTAASFVRPTRPADTSVSFLEALREKYAPSANTSKTSLAPENSEVWISGKRVEEVGFDKVRAQQAALRELKIVVLDGSRIGGMEVGTGGADESTEWEEGVQKIVEICPNIQELDLSRNLIERWVDVVGICSALEGLKRVVLNGNRFRCLMADIEATGTAEAFTNVEELSLSSTYMSWEEILALLPQFPSLQTLFLASNNLITRIPHFQCSTLQALSLASNPLPSLTFLTSLSLLPKLKTLSLRYCELTNLSPLSQPLQHVTYLDISSNLIPNLDALPDLISSFPALSSLRVSQNPFFVSLPSDEAHMLTLARLPGVTLLNYSTITLKERENAELYYLSRIRGELEGLKPGSNRDEVLARHPQWKALCEKHGQEIIPQLVDEDDGKQEIKDVDSAGSMAARLVRLQLKLLPIEGAPPPDSKRGEAEPSLTVPKTINIYRLKALIAIKISVPPTKFRLVWETGELDPVSKNLFGLGVPGAGEKIWEAESDSDDEEEESEHETEPRESNGSDVGFDPTKWTRREVQLPVSTRPLGYWIEGREAIMRVEILQ